MIKRILVCIIIFAFFQINNSKAQVFDGYGNSMGNIGFEFGNYNNIVFGVTSGVWDYMSFGVDIIYTLNEGAGFRSPIQRFTGQVMVNLHGANLFDFKKSDIIAGYNFNLRGLHGVHMIYQYFITDYVGIYGRIGYYTKVPDKVIVKSIVGEEKLAFQIGFNYRILTTFL